jgi:cellulose synthase/poly-beta-1,6-N-acetylglucosamine synthase-like glycosyltransferase
MDVMISVTIIIPAWNEEKVLEATLEALLAVDYDKKQCEVIVVAGGNDNTYEIAQQVSTTMEVFQRYVVLPQRKRGTKNAPIKQGLREVQNEMIVLLDADTIVSKDWLKRMVDPIEQGRCELTIANSEPVEKNWVSDYYMVIKTYYLDSITTHPGHAIAFRASVVENRPEYFFDENVWMGDDYVFQKKVIEEGHRTIFVREANVRTHYPCSLRYFVEIECRWALASIHLDGANFKNVMCNTIVIGALISLVPFSKTLLTLSSLFNVLYVAKKAHMFLVASKQYNTKLRRVFGFVFLSYLNHIVSFLSYICYFLGLRRDTYYQGER